MNAHLTGIALLVLIAAVLAGCRNEKQLGYLTHPVPTSLNCDRVVVPVRPAEPGVQYHIDARQENGQRVCYVT